MIKIKWDEVIVLRKQIKEHTEKIFKAKRAEFIIAAEQIVDDTIREVLRYIEQNYTLVRKK